MSLDEGARRRVLTDHFFASFFRLTFLDDAGEASFKRALLGALAVLASGGLFVARLYASKYSGVAPALTADMVHADRLFAIVLPMFATATAMTLASASLFPDELDFRVLMALPLRRRTVFLAKGAALGRFAAMVVAVTVLTMTAPLALIISGREPRALPSIVSLLLAAALAGTFVCLMVTSLQGLVAALSPPNWRRRTSVWMQTMSIAALVLCLPFALRASAAWRLLPAEPGWLMLLPPTWFLGAERWFAGDGTAWSDRCALLAVAGLLLAWGLAGWCHVRVYRRFDSASVRTSERYPGRARRPFPWRRRPRAETTAVADLMRATMSRSSVHRLACSMTVAVGAALAINGLLGAWGARERWVMQAMLSVPFALMAGSVTGLRAAFLIPSHVRANWLFRLTETADSRPRVLDAVRNTFFWRGVLYPTLASFPVVTFAVGLRTALTLAPVTLLLGAAFIDILCIGWRRVPFSSTLLFAKRPPAVTLGALVAVFGWFVFLGAAVLSAARAGWVAWSLVTCLVALVAGTTRWWRLQEWGLHPLEFEDTVPDAVQTLRLAAGG